MGLILYTDGTQMPVEPMGFAISAAELKGYVGQSVGIMRLNRYVFMAFDRDAPARNEPVNHAATRLYREIVPPGYDISKVLMVGDVLLLHFDELEGDPDTSDDYDG